jgi:hypothetical protein
MITMRGLQERDEDIHPAANQALWDSIMDGAKEDGVFPEIFNFEQKIIMHMGEKPYHPANRRVTLWVRLEDLKMKYGLSHDAIIHVVTVRIPQLLVIYPLCCALLRSVYESSGYINRLVVS